MSGNIKIYVSHSTNPWFNLATEDWLFQELTEFDHILFLWRNADTVVIGRSQNPWAECHLDKMEADNVCLARRQSGGGAVFHDLGNTNFTFISKKSDYNKQENLTIIINALQKLGIKAEASGRNDLVAFNTQGESRKISGSAFKEKANRAFHHGTLLINANLTRLVDYLSPNKKKLAAKGVKSVRSRVMNLTELDPNVNHTAVCAAIMEAFREAHHSKIHAENLDLPLLKNIVSLNQYFETLKSWNWLYGQTLQFTHKLEERFDWGTIDCQFDVNNGVINDLRIYSDSLYPDMIDELITQMRNQKYAPEVLRESINKTREKFPERSTELSQLSAWLEAGVV